MLATCAMCGAAIACPYRQYVTILARSDGDASPLVLDTVAGSANFFSARCGNSAGDNAVRSGTRSSPRVTRYSAIKVVIWCLRTISSSTVSRYGYCSTSWYARLHAGNEQSLPPPPLQWRGYAFWRREWFGYLAGERTPTGVRVCRPYLLSTFHHAPPGTTLYTRSRFNITLDETLSLVETRKPARETTPFLMRLLPARRCVT